MQVVKGVVSSSEVLQIIAEARRMLPKEARRFVFQRIKEIQLDEGRTFTRDAPLMFAGLFEEQKPLNEAGKKAILEELERLMPLPKDNQQFQRQLDRLDKKLQEQCNCGV